MTREQWFALCNRSELLQRQEGDRVYTNPEYREICRLLKGYGNRHPTAEPIPLPSIVRLDMRAATMAVGNWRPVIDGENAAANGDETTELRAKVRSLEAEVAALRHDLERSMARENEYLNQVIEGEKADAA